MRLWSIHDKYLSSLKPAVSLHDITTERGQDYHASPPKQVQFNPGQTRAVWRLRIHDDQVYEGSESFRLVLSEPVMALIGQSSSVTVEILDPEDGREDLLIINTISVRQYIIDHDHIIIIDNDRLWWCLNLRP